jgi:hypothetical protein
MDAVALHDEQCPAASSTAQRQLHECHTHFPRFHSHDESESPRCGERNRGRGVWFTFTGTGERVSAVNMCDSGIADIYVSIYKGTCGAATLKCHADFGFSCKDKVPFMFSTSIATTYYMLVQSTYSIGPYNYDLMLVNAPPNIGDNDVCSKSQRVKMWTNVVGNISFATSDENEVTSDCVGGSVTSSQQWGLWYRFLGTGASVWVNTCAAVGSNTMQTQVSVYKGSCGQATLQCVAGALNPCMLIADAPLQKFTFGTEANTIYYVLVRNRYYGERVSLFNLQITSVQKPRMDNDECSAATPIMIGQSIVGDIEFANPEPTGAIKDCMYSPGTFNKGRRGLWYSFQGNGGAVKILGRCFMDSTGTHISIYTGTCGVATLQCVSGFDIYCGSSIASIGSSNINTVSGTRYYVHVSDIENWPFAEFGFSTTLLSPVAPIKALPVAPTITSPIGEAPAPRPPMPAGPMQSPPSSPKGVSPVVSPAQSPPSLPTGLAPTLRAPLASPAGSPPNSPSCRILCRTGRLFKAILNIFRFQQT